MADDPILAEQVPSAEPGGEAGLTGSAASVAPAKASRGAASDSTRASATWAALAAGLFFLIVVLVFILQNLKSVKVHFFWATWSVPLAVDLLLATVLGGLVMFAGGATRIIQLRRRART